MTKISTTNINRPAPTRLFWAGLILLVVTYAVIEALWARPMVWADSAAGFNVWDSMRAGASWNCYSEPDPANIARNHEVFRTWWSPGQYVPVGLLTLTGLSLGVSIVVVTLVGVLIGLAGCWRLFKAWEFPEPVVMTSVAIIALGWHTSFLFGMFNGGELALFAGFPWIALAATRLADKSRWLLVALPPLFLIGAFLKLSFPLIALALCAGLWLGRNDTPWRINGSALRLACVLCGSFALFYIILWMLFLSRGSMPGDAGQVEYAKSLLFGFSATGPLLATGAFASLISRAVFFPGASLLGNWNDLGEVLCLLIVPALALYALAWLKTPGHRYRGMLVGFVLGYCVLFTLLYYRGASISIDDRHFRPAAIVLIPGLAQAGFFTGRIWLRRILIGLALLTVIYGLAGFANRVNYIRSIDNVGIRGCTQNVSSRSATTLLHTLDLAIPVAEGSTVYVTSPTISLDISRMRIIQTHADQESSAALGEKHYLGRVNNLLIITSATTSAKQLTAILKSFVSYKQSAWRCHKEDGCRFYYQGDWLDSVLHGQPTPVFN